MIKVENDMLVLDSSFTKEDVQAIDYFVHIAVDKERERIVKLLEDNKWRDEVVFNYIIALIKGENK